MKSDLPVRQQALEAAREAARRRGVTAGEWLDAAILNSALQKARARPPPRPQYPCDEGADEHMPIALVLDMAADRLRGDLAEMGLILQQALPRRAIEALESEVRRLADQSIIHVTPAPMRLRSRVSNAGSRKCAMHCAPSFRRKASSV